MIHTSHSQSSNNTHSFHWTIVHTPVSPLSPFSLSTPPPPSLTALAYFIPIFHTVYSPFLPFPSPLSTSLIYPIPSFRELSFGEEAAHALLSENHPPFACSHSSCSCSSPSFSFSFSCYFPLLSSHSGSIFSPSAVLFFIFFLLPHVRTHCVSFWFSPIPSFSTHSRCIRWWCPFHLFSLLPDSSLAFFVLQTVYQLQRMNFFNLVNLFICISFLFLLCFFSKYVMFLCTVILALNIYFSLFSPTSFHILPSACILPETIHSSLAATLPSSPRMTAKVLVRCCRSSRCIVLGGGVILFRVLTSSVSIVLILRNIFSVFVFWVVSAFLFFLCKKKFPYLFIE